MSYAAVNLFCNITPFFKFVSHPADNFYGCEALSFVRTSLPQRNVVRILRYATGN